MNLLKLPTLKMTSRRLPKTDTMASKENAALRNKVKCLEASLEQAYKDINDPNRGYCAIIEKLQKENAALKKDNSLLVDSCNRELYDADRGYFGIIDKLQKEKSGLERANKMYKRASELLIEASDSYAEKYYSCMDKLAVIEN